MKTMSSKQIKDHYGAFAETARSETVVHTNHGRPTLVTISIDRARTIPELQDELEVEKRPLSERIERFMALGGIGAPLSGYLTKEEMRARSRDFRGDD